jgi:hypothetical protein
VNDSPLAQQQLHGLPPGLETDLTLDVLDELLAELPTESTNFGTAMADAPIADSPPTVTPTTAEPADPTSDADPEMTTGPAFQPRPHGDIEPFVPDGQMPI